MPNFGQNRIEFLKLEDNLYEMCNVFFKEYQFIIKVNVSSRSGKEFAESLLKMPTVKSTETFENIGWDQLQNPKSIYGLI